jgi:prolipoprotein diacylglyceryltransferase
MLSTKLRRSAPWTTLSLDQLFIIFAFAAGAAVYWWSVRETKPNANGVAWVALIGAVTGIIGVKVTEWIFLGFKMPPLLTLHPDAGGRALWGGMCFAFIGAELAKRRFGIKGTTIDSFVLAIPIAEIVGRIACWLNGCCYGEHSVDSWAVYQHDAWRYPTQFYSMLTAAAIFGVLFAVRKKMAYDGQLFLVFLILFASSRFFIEEVRWQSGNSIWGLTAMQWFCIDMLSIGTVRLIRHHIKNSRQSKAEQSSA